VLPPPRFNRSLPPPPYFTPHPFNASLVSWRKKLGKIGGVWGMKKRRQKKVDVLIRGQNREAWRRQQMNVCTYFPFRLAVRPPASEYITCLCSFSVLNSLN
jgi:hypothetical protein